MPDYMLSKIYKITVPDHGLYVASTTQKLLSSRRSGHVALSRSRSGMLLYQAVNALETKWDNIHLELVESYPCNHVDKLRKREAFWIKKLKANLNKTIPGRTNAEWRADNKEYIFSAKKKYRDENKEKIAEKKRKDRLEHIEELKAKDKAYYEKNKEQKTLSDKSYRENNKEQVALRNKLWRQNNREEIIKKDKLKGKKYYNENKMKFLEKRAVIVSCPYCDAKMRRDSCNTHIRRFHKDAKNSTQQFNKLVI
jgi:hypothetical protein